MNMVLTKPEILKNVELKNLGYKNLEFEKFWKILEFVQKSLKNLNFKQFLHEVVIINFFY